MSQYGGGKPGGGAAWNRPPGGAPMPGFPALSGVGGLQLGMSVGMPLGMVNQAAFQQPNLMGMPGMGIMGQMPAQQVPRPAQPANGMGGVGAGAAAVGAGATAKQQQRTFIGTVTKMHDSYGFVDDDVFFQHSVIRGAHPRIGDRVMVEANFNPQMPFKWNAISIQVLNKTVQSVPATTNQALLNAQAVAANAVVRAQASDARSPPNQTTANRSAGSRWGMPESSGSAVGRNRSPAPKRGSSPGRRAASPRGRASPSRRSPRRRSRSRSRSARRVSPPPIRRPSPPGARADSASRQADRKRDRSPAHSERSTAAAATRRDSASPPRRRARIIPRYEARIAKPVPFGELLSCGVLRSRYTKLYVPSDFVDLTADWVRRVPLDANIDMTNPVSFHVWHKDVDVPKDEDESEAVLEPDDADHRYQVKVMLFSHAGRLDYQKRAFCLLPDGTTDDKEEPSNPFKQLQFLVGLKGKETMALGGSWSPSLDGADPNSPTTVIKTAIRTMKALTGIDLSNVPQWYQLATLRYYRAERDRVDVVHLLLPDTQLLMPADEDEWQVVLGAIRAQLDAKLAAIDALQVPVPAAPTPVAHTSEQAKDDTTVPSDSAAAAASEIDKKEPTADGKKDEQQQVAEDKKQAVEQKTEVKIEDGSAKEADVSMTSADGNTSAVAAAEEGGKTHWSKLDPKSLKVAELRAELEARGFETKGIKTLLVQRLTDALEKEKEEEEKDGTAGSQSIGGDTPVDTSQLIETDSTDIKKEDTTSMTAAAEAEAAKKAQEKSEAEKKKAAEELQKKIDKLEKEKKEKKEALERHFAPPKDKKVFVYPSKTAKSGKFDCKVLPLQTLLDYRQDDNKETQFEVSIFAEAFKELLERLAAFQIYKSIVEAADKDSEKKKRDDARKAKSDDKDEAMDESKKEDDGKEKDEKKDEGKEKDDKEKKDRDEKKKDGKKEREERIELKSVVHHRQMYEAYAFFDLNLCGYLMTRDVEDILYNNELGISRGQMQKLVHKLIQRDKLNYRHLTDVLTDADGNVRHTPGTTEVVPALEQLVKGYGHRNVEAAETGAATGVSSASSDGTVVINGNVVNVAMKLALLKKAEAERDTAKTALTEQQSLVAQLREAKSDIEKKKRDLEKDYDKVKKKLNDTNSALKNSMDDSAAIRNALLDCKKYGERLIGVVEKVFPPSPSKKEKKEETAKENGTNKDEKKKDEGKEKSKEAESPATSAQTTAASKEVIALEDGSEDNEKSNGVEKAAAEIGGATTKIEKAAGEPMQTETNV